MPPLADALSSVVITDMQAVLVARENPTIVTWERTEGRPRNTENFDRALRAEVHDALWMLSRQWQMGEFKGDDAGSPAVAKFHLESTPLHKYRPDGPAQPVQPFDDSVPLETQVEQRPLVFQQASQIVALDLRLVMGRYWLKLLAAAGLDATVRADFLNKFPIARPDPDAAADAAVCAHREAWQQFAAVGQGRALDGYALYEFLRDNSFAPDWTAITGAAPATLDDAMNAFRAWYERQFYQPAAAEQHAWRSDYLEYQFACAAPKPGGEEVLTADEYYHGHLDWYNFDFDRSEKTVVGYFENLLDIPKQLGYCVRMTQENTATAGARTHTRGPWRIGGKGSYHQRHYIEVMADVPLRGNRHGATMEMPVCEVGVNDADAQLIAAAPELLDALNRALFWIELADQHDMNPAAAHAKLSRDIEESHGCFEDAMTAIRGALAKAQGKESGDTGYSIHKGSCPYEHGGACTCK